jgi:hypothetical protein
LPRRWLTNEFTDGERADLRWRLTLVSPVAKAADARNNFWTPLNLEDSRMNLMSVDLYQSATNPTKFLAIPSGVDPNELTGPMTFDKDYAQVVRYREAFEFDPDEAYTGVNAAKIAADLLTVKWATYRRT